MGEAIGSDSYRENNAYSQYNGVADFRYVVDRGSLYLNITADDQRLGLPGARRVEPSKGINQLETDPRGRDYAVSIMPTSRAPASLPAARRCCGRGRS